MQRRILRRASALMRGAPCMVAVFMVPVFMVAVFMVALLPATCAAAPAKSHLVTFGKWMAVTSPDTNHQGQPQTLKVRPLIIDGRIKEYTFGPVHEVTERLFVAQRAFRLNDSLPDDAGAPRWQWQRGGWLLVDRSTGHISAINLPEFDSNYSAASWYRDYVAYCGISDDGKKISAVVVQLNRRKAVLKKLLSDEAAKNGDGPAGSACPEPTWQRSPMRVSFEASAGARQTFAIRGRAADLVNDTETEEEDEEASK